MSISKSSSHTMENIQILSFQKLILNKYKHNKITFKITNDKEVIYL